MSQPTRKTISVWSARGGHGATTVATVLAAFLGTNPVSAESWIPEWILGHPIVPDPGYKWTVLDKGRARAELDPGGINLTVLRGPDLVGLRSLPRPGDASSAVVLISEPWRALDRAATEAALERPIDIEVPFSERVARLADAGLLGARLPELEEFAEMRSWVDRVLNRPSEAAVPPTD